MNLIATLTVAACAAGAAYLWAFGPEGDLATASPQTQVSDAPTAPSDEASPEAPASPEPTTPTDATPDPGAAPSAETSATPSDAPADGGSPAPSAPEDVESSAAAADVALSYLAWNPESRAVEASGYAAVYEDGGTCRLVLTKDGASASAESAALPDVQTTSCGGLEVPGSELSGGTWLAVLEYTSPTSAGSSAPRAVVVP